jgi:hypothetical protein
MDDQKLKWLFDSINFVITRLGVETAAARAMVAVEVLITLFLVLAITLVLFHDLVIFLITVFSGGSASSHEMQVFYVSVIVMVISLGAVFGREALK